MSDTGNNHDFKIGDIAVINSCEDSTKWEGSTVKVETFIGNNMLYLSVLGTEEFTVCGYANLTKPI